MKSITNIASITDFSGSAPEITYSNPVETYIQTAPDEETNMYDPMHCLCRCCRSFCRCRTGCGCCRLFCRCRNNCNRCGCCKHKNAACPCRDDCD